MRISLALIKFSTKTNSKLRVLVRQRKIRTLLISLFNKERKKNIYKNPVNYNNVCTLIKFSAKTNSKIPKFRVLVKQRKSKLKVG